MLKKHLQLLEISNIKEEPVLSTGTMGKVAVGARPTCENANHF